MHRVPFFFMFFYILSIPVQWIPSVCREHVWYLLKRAEPSSTYSQPASLTGSENAFQKYSVRRSCTLYVKSRFVDVKWKICKYNCFCGNRWAIEVEAWKERPPVPEKRQYFLSFNEIDLIKILPLKYSSFLHNVEPNALVVNRVT